MIIQVDMAYRKFWKKYAQYKGSTSTYALFLAKLESDHVYKRNVDTYITSIQTETQRQKALEGTLNYGKN